MKRHGSIAWLVAFFFFFFFFFFNKKKKAIPRATNNPCDVTIQYDDYNVVVM